MICERDIQCIQLAHCTHNVSEPHSDIKICQCREEYADDDGTCSGEWDVWKQITQLVSYQLCQYNKMY